MRLYFANCVLDRATRELWRDGETVHLPPKAYSLLDSLIRERPRVVTRAELDELLWPRTYVARSSLGRLVAELRAAIGDDAHAPCIVRTAHGVGYAFCASIKPAPARTAAPQLVLIWRGEPVLLADGEHMLGRDSGCQIMVDATGVSRQHARIDVDGRQALIQDLSSKNGTFVNRRRIGGPTPLEHLDEIAVGTAVLTIRRLTDSATTRTVFRI